MTGVLLVYCAKDSEHFRLGGLENAVFAHISALLTQGIKPTLWTSSRHCAEYAEKLGAAALYDPRIHNGIKPLLSAKLRKEARDFKRSGVTAAIHNSGRTWLWGLVLFPRIPHAHVLHRHRLGNYRYFRNWISLSTRWSAEMLERHGVLGWRRVATVPNGMRRDFTILEQPPEPREAKDQPTRVVALGRVHFVRDQFNSKGFDVLVQAAAHLKEQGQTVEILIGGGEDKKLSSYINELGVSDSVRIIGYVHDVEAYMRDADIFVTPSRLEPFGLVITEAMAQARPVVASASHGASDIVIDGETGLIVPIEDPKAMADAIAHLAQNPCKAQAMGIAGHARVRSHYNDEAIGEHLVKALQSFGAKDL